MDFVTVPRPDGSWHCPAIEVNLRWGGTTHPAATMRLLTHGHLDPTTGLYVSDQGVAKYYCASRRVACRGGEGRGASCTAMRSA